MDIQAKEILRLKKSVHDILSRHTEQPIERIRQDIERDFFMDSEEAVNYGLIDKIIEKRELKDSKE